MVKSTSARDLNHAKIFTVSVLNISGTTSLTKASDKLNIAGMEKYTQTSVTGSTAEHYEKEWVYNYITWRK